MQKLTIGRMAKLYGLHRSTLYEAVEKGRVTAGLDGKGQRVIDLSEMIRVYDEPPNKPDAALQPPTPIGSPQAELSPTPDTLTLLAELVELNRQQAARLEGLESEVKQLRESMLLLPAPPAPEKPGTPPRDFSDVLKRFEARKRQ
ncbi:hypothetical protein ACT3R7_11680 [Halomonas sp. AOP43-A1-21]